MLFIPHRSVARISSCLFSTIFQSTAGEPNPSFFFIHSLLCHSLPKGCVSPLLRNKQARGQQEWYTGSTFQAAPPLSNHKCHQPLRLSSPDSIPRQVPSIQASPCSPGWGWTGYAAGCLTASNFLFGYKKQNEAGQTATPGAVQPAYSKVGGLCTNPTLQLHFSDRKRSRCCSQGVRRGYVCRCIPALREHAKALALSLGTTGCFTSEPV